MSHSTDYIETQFTEDAYAQGNRLCQRLDCKHPDVKPGEPYLYVADIDQSKPAHPYVPQLSIEISLITGSRDVSQGQILFGDGNLEHGVTVFEDQHVCNKFCKWPGFNLEPFGKGAGGA